MSRLKITNARRKQRVRLSLRRSAGGRPRLSVFRSSKHIYAQIIDDRKGATVAAASSLEKDMRGKTMPQIGRVEISIIEESQSEILAFTQGDLDLVARAFAGFGLSHELVVCGDSSLALGVARLGPRVGMEQVNHRQGAVGHPRQHVERVAHP